MSNFVPCSDDELVETLAIALQGTSHADHAERRDPYRAYMRALALVLRMRGSGLVVVRRNAGQVIPFAANDRTPRPIRS